MKQVLSLFLVAFLIYSCTGEKKNMIVQGEVKNLKKGTLYLEKVKDTVLISVDSVIVKGDGNFRMATTIDTPEMYYLSLNHSNENRIPFFGEEGTITVRTSLDKFGYGARVEGLTNQQLLDEYNEMKSKFTDKNLNLVKAGFDAQRAGDSLLTDSINTAILNLLKSRYRYTANFAVTHPDNEVSPYLALSEMYDANITWLDSINNSLSPKVKASKYGLELQKYLDKLKGK
ncbi:MAG: DUF4369 domain-containing protein [Flavobacteriaceae bacterium]|nr:DUF4369 domain-containing protein [Flavobacteriaceae bacterium]